MKCFRAAWLRHHGQKPYIIVSQKLNNLETSILERLLPWRKKHYTSLARVTTARNLTLHFWH